ncbi:conjugative transposon protein TraM [Algoriphagus sp. A40]|uniref:conjugative transposon protein TraM n=1 Tax=Algoriphagus sp. A40 TaxID=1945863 RepID=UPI0009875E96|nr:conjugative transposon protein TraM [Algoriphagus sp. A40]OOG76484.1 conjugative transposon protein TraM [Algoriphagus sp. A40]
MTHPNHPKSQQKRKFLLMLPILTLPFLTLTFWSLGGGSRSESFQMDNPKEGFNLELPGLIENKEKALDKLGHYQRSSADSSRFRQEVKNDPYYRMAFMGGQGDEDVPSQEYATGTSTSQTATVQTSTPGYQTTPEEQILQRLEALNRTLNESPQNPGLPETHGLASNHLKPATANTALSSDLDRLDQMMQQMQNTHSEPDPEFQQMAELLDRILDIQHPERVQERMLAQKTVRETTPPKSLHPAPNQDFTTLESYKQHTAAKETPSNGFFGLESISPQSQSQSNSSVKAVIHEDQTLVSGSTVKLRITQETNLGDITLPKDQLIYGIASLNGERLKISIRHIRLAEQILPVDLKIHDADGLEGILIPGSISQEVSSQTGSQTIQGLGFNSLDYSLEAQAANAGIETAKSFLGKKIKQVKVSLKAGYQVWIIDNI